MAFLDPTSMACLRSAWTVATSGTDGSGTNRRRPESNETNGSGRQGRGAWQGSLDATGDTTDSRGDSCRTSAGSAIHGMVGETSSPQGRQQHDWQHVDRSTSRGQQQVDQRQGSILMHTVHDTALRVTKSKQLTSGTNNKQQRSYMQGPAT